MIFAAWGYPSGLLFLCSFGILIAINVPSIIAATSGSGHGHTHNANDVFTSSFLVRFKRSVDNDFAHKVASSYGFDNIGPLSEKIYKHMPVDIKEDLKHHNSNDSYLILKLPAAAVKELEEESYLQKVGHKYLIGMITPTISKVILDFKID